MRSAGLVLISLVLGAAPSAGCGKKSATCEEAAANIVKLMGVKEENRKEALEEWTADCKRSGKSQEVIRCVARAQGISDLDRCRDVEDKSGTQAAARAKSTEAIANVRKLYEGARAYFEEEHVSPGAITVAPEQFPGNPAVSPQPPVSTCCKQPGGRCAPDLALWQDPTWQALKFAIADPHYYSYYYQASGTGTNAKFSVGAHGDLDCDGILSTFEMVGSVAADGTVTGQAAMYKNNVEE